MFVQKKSNHMGFYQTIGDFVYETIKKEILEMILKPGDQISEKEIAERLKVSRTPARESILRLSKENLLDVVPYRGTYVSKISIGDVTEAWFIRHTLEEKIISLAINIFTNREVQILQDILNKQKLAVETSNYSQFFELDELFHYTFYKECNRLNTWNIIQTIYNQYKRIRIITLDNDVKIMGLYKEHIEILEGIVTKNIDKSLKGLKNHLEKLGIEIKSLQKKYPEYFVD